MQEEFLQSSLPSLPQTAWLLPEASSHEHLSDPPAREIDWRGVDYSRIFSPDSFVLETDKLYTGYSKLIVVVFVPRKAIELCALVYGKVVHLLHQARARLVFITPWSQPSPSHFCPVLRRFLRFLVLSFVIRMLPYRAQNRDIASIPVSSKRLKCRAVLVPSLRGYTKQPIITFLNDEAPSTGVGCYLGVPSACRGNEAFVPDIDVSQVYSRFNSMRDASASIKERTALKKELGRARSQKQRSSRKIDRRSPKDRNITMSPDDSSGGGLVSSVASAGGVIPKKHVW